MGLYSQRSNLTTLTLVSLRLVPTISYHRTGYFPVNLEPWLLDFLYDKKTNLALYTIYNMYAYARVLALRVNSGQAWRVWPLGGCGDTLRTTRNGPPPK